MLRLFFFILCFCAAQSGIANPGGSLVADRSGTVYFTGKEGVWMQRKTGEKKLVAAGLHVHQLRLDSNGVLYGDHQWYSDTRQLLIAGHYSWRYTEQAGVERISDSLPGTPKEQSLVQDAAGNRYALEAGIPSVIWQTDPAGNSVPIAEVSFSGLGPLHITQRGVLLFSNRDEVYALLPGDQPEKIAAGIGELNSVTGDSSRPVIQLWSDNRRNIYAATGTVIKKIDHRRFVTAVYQSAGGWYPAGGWVSDNGDFYVLEYNRAGEARVQFISFETRQEIGAANRKKFYLFPLFSTAAVVLVLILVFRRKKKPE